MLQSDKLKHTLRNKMSGIRCPMCDYDIDDCECADRWPDGRPLQTERLDIAGNTINRQADEIGKLEEILSNAIEWWLLEGRKGSIGAPAWVFTARQLLDNERKMA